jgi:hypothetical protein
MSQLPASITIVIALLAAFLSLLTVYKYAITNDFVRTRAIMTSFFCFIVLTLTISFWQYTTLTLPYTVPAAILGVILGYFLGVKTEQQKLRVQGLQHYMEHFSHVHVRDITSLNWWAVVNFYSVMGGLILINLVGLSSVIFRGSEEWAIFSSVLGAFLLGTIVPYLMHLWSVKVEAN